MEWGDRSTGAISKVSIVGADSFVNNSTQTEAYLDGNGDWRITSYNNGVSQANSSTVATEFAAMGAASDYAYLSGHADDMIRFDDIDPGADRMFQIVITTMLSGRLDSPTDTMADGNANDLIGLDAFALAQDIPEPATMSLLCLGGGLILLRRRRT